MKIFNYKSPVFLLIVSILLFIGCNSASRKINRIKKIDAEIENLKSKSSIDNIVETTTKQLELIYERETILKELKEINKSKLTPEQIDIIYSKENKFVKLFSEGKNLFYNKNYSEALVRFENAKALQINDDSINEYYYASKAYTLCDALKKKNVKIDLSEADSISKLLINLGNNVLIKNEEKAKLTKDIERYREEIYTTFFANNISELYKNKGIYQYKNHIDYTNTYLKMFKSSDSLYSILKNPKIKSIYKKIDDANKKSYINYLAYGQPTLDDLEMAARTYLEKTMNNPSSLEVIEKEAFAKQYKNGYTYRMKIRGTNAFGAIITNVETFYCQYDLSSNSYYCIASN